MTHILILANATTAFWNSRSLAAKRQESRNILTQISFTWAGARSSTGPKADGSTPLTTADPSAIAFRSHSGSAIVQPGDGGRVEVAARLTTDIDGVCDWYRPFSVSH